MSTILTANHIEAVTLLPRVSVTKKKTQTFKMAGREDVVIERIMSRWDAAGVRALPEEVKKIYNVVIGKSRHFASTLR